MRCARCRELPSAGKGRQGTVTQVRIRGAEANHTVVLIDGVKINDPFTSEVDFATCLQRRSIASKFCADLRVCCMARRQSAG
jgi:hypothetical protein